MFIFLSRKQEKKSFIKTRKQENKKTIKKNHYSKK